MSLDTPLLNEDGSAFEDGELSSIKSEIEKMDDDDRENFRNQNSNDISSSPEDEILIVSGPGTGKTYLFKERIEHWLKNKDGNILVTTLVGKLADDLREELKNELSENNFQRVTVSTLHKFARSVVEKNNGTSGWEMDDHIQVITDNWEHIIWNDVVSITDQADAGDYSWKDFESQLFNNDFLTDNLWPDLQNSYWKLTKFYNAAGFSDLIIKAQQAIQEKPELNDYNLFVLDEYQDFNQAEDDLINEMISSHNGLLIVGDDEQVLYEKLKNGHPDLIRNRYNNDGISNALLPVCSRCGSHIVNTAHEFLESHREEVNIKKVYTPINKSDGDKVKSVFTFTPSSAVSYIERFINEHEEKIQEREEELKNGDSDEPFLLILSPSSDMAYLGDSKDALLKILEKNDSEEMHLSDDYLKVLNFYKLNKNPNNNFIFRKLLELLKVKDNKILEFISNCLDNNSNFSDLENEIVQEILIKASKIHEILEGNNDLEKIIEVVSKILDIKNGEKLHDEFENYPITNVSTQDNLEKIREDQEDMEELSKGKVSPIETMSIVGSKGLSADHVIILGFDDKNFDFITPNAFYVAITRARKSLHIVSALKARGARSPHNYISNLPEKDLDYLVYKKGDDEIVEKSGLNDWLSYIEWFKEKFLNESNS